MTKAYAVIDRHGNIWGSKLGGYAIFSTERAAKAFAEVLDRPAINDYRVRPVRISLQNSSERKVTE